jgi:hypothetical protein
MTYFFMCNVLFFNQQIFLNSDYLNMLTKMNKKESLGLLGFGSLFLVLSVRLVSAASSGAYMQAFIDWINSNYGPIFGALLGTSGINDFLFTKVLLLILLFAIIFMILKNLTLFRGQRSITFLVSAIVSILSVRYLGEDSFIAGLLLPYGALGASMIVFLPMIIYFMFVNTSIPGGFGRRAAWFTYGIILLLLWGSRTDLSSSADWMYILGIGFVLLNFIFDKSIHAYFELGGVARARRGMTRGRRLELQRELRNAIESGDVRAAEEITKELNILAREIGS